MLIIALFGFLIGGFTVEQYHYDKCKDVGFHGHACKAEKALNESQK